MAWIKAKAPTYRESNSQGLFVQPAQASICGTDLSTTNLFMNRKLPPSKAKAKNLRPKPATQHRPPAPKAPPEFRLSSYARQTNPDKKSGVIYFLFGYGRETVKFSTNTPCTDTGLYDPNRMLGGIAEADSNQLREWEMRAKKMVADLRLTGRPISLRSIRDALFSSELAQFKTLTVHQGVDLYIAYQKQRYRAGQIVQRTFWKNSRWANDFRSWTDRTLGKNALLTDLKPSDMRAFSLWLQTDRQHLDRSTTERLSSNSAESTASHAKAMSAFWFDNELINRNPYINFRRKMRSVEYNCLTEEEVSRLFSLSIESKSLSTVRDVFVFMCLTAIGWAEAEKLTTASVKLENGQPYLEVFRRKMMNRAGNRPALIPLDPTAVNLLARYWPEKDSADTPLFPVQENQAFNRSLKQLAHMAGIDKNLSSNYGRKSLANYALANGLPSSTISAILGHSDLGTLMRHYARHQPGRVLSDFGKLTSDLPNNTLYGLGGIGNKP